MPAATDVHGLIAAGFRVAMFSYRLLRRDADTSHCDASDTKNRYEALSYCWRHVEEKIRGLQSDQCSKRYGEVDQVLERAGHLAQRLKLKVDMEKHTASAPGNLGLTTVDSQAGWDSFECILPAAELLEEALDRFWLHVHLVYIRDGEPNILGAASPRYSDKLTTSARKPEAGSDWVELERVPVIRRGYEETGQEIQTQLKRNARAILVDESCINLAQSEGLLGTAQRSALSALPQKAWGLDLRSSIILSEFPALMQEPGSGSRHENRLTIVHKTRASASTGRNDAEWLCFSDLLEPANSRPMFGHLLRRHSASNPLQRARVRALMLVDSILELPQGTSARSKATGLGSLETIEELLDCSYWLIDQQAEPLDRVTSQHTAELAPELDEAVNSVVGSATDSSDFGFKKSTFRLRWFNRDSFYATDRQNGVPTRKSHLLAGRQSRWTDWYPEKVVERHFAVRAAQCVLVGVRSFDLRELFAAATTKIRSKDPAWSDCSSNVADQLLHFLEVCSPFLRADERGRIVFRSADIVEILLRDYADFAVEAQTFVASMCLHYLCKMDPRTMIWPWSNYQNLVADQENYVLHGYVVNNWQHHYQLAERYNTDLPRHLHGIIEHVWLRERTDLSDQGNSSFRDVDLDAYNEALDVGLILSQAYDFAALTSAYVNMGARTQRGIFDQHKQADEVSSPDLSDVDEDMTVLSTPSPNITPSHIPKPETGNDDPFDFSGWTSIPPLNPP